jgi:hypothetical protein
VVIFSYLYQKIIQSEYEAISGNLVVFARNCLAYKLDYILMQMTKVNRKKGYFVSNKGIFQVRYNMMKQNASYISWLKW